MDNVNNVNRRRVLRGAAAAGASTVGATGLAAAESDSEAPWEATSTETVSEALFAEIGMVFDGDFPSTDEACRAKPYHIDEQEGILFLPTMPEADRQLISDNDAVARHKGIESLPTKVTRSEVKHLPTSVNDHLASREAVTVQNPVRIPAVHFDTDGEDAVRVKVGGAESAVPAGETGRVPLDPVPAKARERRGTGGADSNGNGGGSGQGSGVEATPEVVVNNYGPLRFLVSAEGDAA